MSAAVATPEFEKATFTKVAAKLIPVLFLCYIVAFLDRVNVGFAKLQMAGDLKFSDAIYGFGAGVFFIGYFFFEVPSNVILEKVGARMWIARIMITWGIISAAFMFTGDIGWGGLAGFFGQSDAQFTFYVLRFLLGAAEAGFFPGIILYLTYWFPAQRRAQAVALFMSAIGVCMLIGSPVSGAIMQYMDGMAGWRGWHWLFLLEGIPSVVMGIVVLFVLPNGPRDAKWLTSEEKNLVLSKVEEENVNKKQGGGGHGFADAFKSGRVWALCLVYFCLAVCFYAINFWMPTIIQELGIDKKDLLKVGLISMIPWGASIIAMNVWGRHSDKTGERRWHAASGMLLIMLGMLILALAHHSPALSILALTFVAMGWAGCVCTFWSLPTAFLTGTAAAAGIAWINSVGNLGGHFGPDLIGRIRTASGGATEAAFYTLTAVALIGAITILLLPKPSTATASSPVQR